jgi:hypothetical protein
MDICREFGLYAGPHRERRLMGIMALQAIHKGQMPVRSIQSTEFILPAAQTANYSEPIQMNKMA